MTDIAKPSELKTGYRGRLAPSPTGLLHLGHARTFWKAFERAKTVGGTLILRNEDLDPQRSRPEFVASYIEDLQWLGIRWQEGPDGGGPFGPYSQSQRMPLYQAAFERLKASGAVYPCTCSRKEIQSSARAPHLEDEEPVYAGTCRPGTGVGPGNCSNSPTKASWRFQVPDGVPVEFVDGNLGPQRFVAGKDFGDFVVWRHDGVPAYQLAVVV
ncbi:MAG TPA: glutamate--tRNA ligase family protein, partial [Roseimicrobium sp.]|nr:glutamate--tRNA ligase family protein [Roseimicrobium sp.]